MHNAAFEGHTELCLALVEMGATVVQGDLDDPASLERAVAGAWGAFAVQNTWEAGVEGEEEQGNRFAEVAKNGGVQHYVYTSVASAQRETGIPHFDNKWRVENRVRELGFPSYTIIRPVFFMENLSSPWFKPAIDEGKLTVGIKPDTSLQMIAVADIGKYGALAFDKHEELNGREIDLAGDAHTMPETAEILSQASRRSLIILDEIGRGTSTFDGLSIAWAVAEYLHDTPGLRARTLFATHYHELTDLARTKSRVENAHFQAREWGEEILFLRRLAPGGASRSYGIQVARLAGLPAVVIERAGVAGDDLQHQVFEIVVGETHDLDREIAWEFE